MDNTVMAALIGAVASIIVNLINNYQQSKKRAIEEAVKEVFDLTPAGIICALHLEKPIYADLACYGHFGRLDLCPPWELADCKHELLLAALKQENQ